MVEEPGEIVEILVGVTGTGTGHGRQQKGESVLAAGGAAKGEESIDGIGGEGGERAGEVDVADGARIEAVEGRMEDGAAGALVVGGEIGFEQPDGATAQRNGGVRCGGHSRNTAEV